MKKALVTLSVMMLFAAFPVLASEEFSPANEPNRTVSWFKKRAAEREAMLAYCKNNPDFQLTSKNCINAQAAEDAGRK